MTIINSLQINLVISEYVLACNIKRKGKISLPLLREIADFADFWVSMFEIPAQGIIKRFLLKIL